MTQMYEVYGPSQVRNTLFPSEKLLKVLTNDEFTHMESFTEDRFESH